MGEFIRVGNTATDEEWAIIDNWLADGSLKNDEERRICYNNMLQNKKWYLKFFYDCIYQKIKVATLTFIFWALFYSTIMDNIVAKMIDFSNVYDTLTECLPVGMNWLIFCLGVAGLEAVWIGIWKIKAQKKFETFKSSLEKALGIKKSKNNNIEKSKLISLIKGKKHSENISLSKYVDQELKEKGSTKNQELIKQENEKNASSFVKQIGEDMKCIISNPYPNYEQDLKNLKLLADEYVNYIVNSNKGDSLLKPKLHKESNFYNRLVDLELAIQNKMKVEKIRRYNEQYLNDILNGSNLTNGIPTLNETFTNTLNDSAGITRTLERTK